MTTQFTTNEWKIIAAQFHANATAKYEATVDEYSELDYGKEDRAELIGDMDELYAYYKLQLKMKKKVPDVHCSTLWLLDAIRNLEIKYKLLPRTAPMFKYSKQKQRKFEKELMKEEFLSPSPTPEDPHDKEWEYCNYGTESKESRNEKAIVSYQVAGGGMMNGNAYATVENRGTEKSPEYYYCEYGQYASRTRIGNKIIWSDEFYDKQNPYESRNFDVVNIQYNEFGQGGLIEMQLTKKNG